jgi:hypothetical protein
MRGVLVGLLAAVGALHLGSLALSWMFSPDYSSVPADTIARSFPAPDGAHKAVSFVSAGGGGLSPYCFQIVGVVEAARPDANAFAPANTVFRSDCDGMVPDKEITWKSASELQIGIDVSKLFDAQLKSYIRLNGEPITVKVAYVNRP